MAVHEQLEQHEHEQIGVRATEARQIELRRVGGSQRLVQGDGKVALAGQHEQDEYCQVRVAELRGVFAALVDAVQQRVQHCHGGHCLIWVTRQLTSQIFARSALHRNEIFEECLIRQVSGIDRRSRNLRDDCESAPKIELAARGGSSALLPN